MRNLILFLFLSCGMFAQKQVFNVQKYCIDEAPFKKGQCDVSGNEYSFVFIDAKKSEVVLFMTDTRLEYKIANTNVSELDSNLTHYTLVNKDGQIEMVMNKAKTKIEFIYPNSHIYLTVGAATKAGLEGKKVTLK